MPPLQQQASAYFRVDQTEEEHIFYISQNYKFETTPEYRLWCEVIWRADYDVQLYLQKQTYERWIDAVDARRWIHSPERNLRSFIWAVEVVFPDIADAFIFETRKRTPEILPPPTHTRMYYPKQKQNLLNVH